MAPSGALVVKAAKDNSGFYWHAKFRLDGQQKLIRLGRAWIERRAEELEGAEGWQRRYRSRRGLPKPGYLLAAQAQVSMRELIRRAAEEQENRRRRKDSISFEYVAEWWLRERKTRAGWKGTTARNYSSMLAGTSQRPKPRGRQPKARIMKAFEGRDIRSITAEDVKNFLRVLSADPELSARSVNAHRTLLQMLFDYAVEEGLRDDNPVKGSAKRREKDLAELITYTPTQILEIADELKDHPTMRAVVIVAGFTGLRRGELLELRWRDIDFEARSIYVQRSIAAGIGVDTTKGRRGRTVPLANQAAQVLQELRKREILTGTNDLVFPGSQSGFRKSVHMDPGTVSKLYAAARDRAMATDPDLPKLSFHGLRHCFGTRCAAAGVDVVSIQSWMGHSSIKTTQRYMHAAPRAEDAARLTAAFEDA